MLTRTFQILTIACLGFVVGCGQTQSTENRATANDLLDTTPGEHADPHDVPVTDAEIDKLRHDTATWALAVKHIQIYRDKIRSATTSGAPAEAHRPLDLLDYVLQWLPAIAQASNVPKNHWQAIGKNTQILRDAFQSVHDNIDGDKPPRYDAVAAEIDAAVEGLAAIKGGDSADTRPSE